MILPSKPGAGMTVGNVFEALETLSVGFFVVQADVVPDGFIPLGQGQSVERGVRALVTVYLETVLGISAQYEGGKREGASVGLSDAAGGVRPVRDDADVVEAGVRAERYFGAGIGRFFQKIRSG